MSGDGKRSVGHWPQATAPIFDSTMAPLARSALDMAGIRGTSDQDSKSKSRVANGRGWHSLYMTWSIHARCTSRPDHYLTALMMRWTAPHKASKCRRVIVEDESPERAVHDKNYHHRDRPC